MWCLHALHVGHRNGPLRTVWMIILEPSRSKPLSDVSSSVLGRVSGICISLAGLYLIVASCCCTQNHLLKVRVAVVKLFRGIICRGMWSVFTVKEQCIGNYRSTRMLQLIFPFQFWLVGSQHLLETLRWRLLMCKCPGHVCWHPSGW